MKIFTKIYDISISAVELRHYLVKHKKLTENEHRNICHLMNHSYEENKKYAYSLLKSQKVFRTIFIYFYSSIKLSDSSFYTFLAYIRFL